MRCTLILHEMSSFGINVSFFDSAASDKVDCATRAMRANSCQTVVLFVFSADVEPVRLTEWCLQALKTKETVVMASERCWTKIRVCSLDYMNSLSAGIVFEIFKKERWLLLLYFGWVVKLDIHVFQTYQLDGRSISFFGFKVMILRIKVHFRLLWLLNEWTNEFCTLTKFFRQFIGVLFATNFWFSW